jgi:leucyl aminopeptidase
MSLPTTTFELNNQPVASLAADWLIAGMWDGESPDAELDRATNGMLSRLREAGDVSGKLLELVPVYAPTGLAAKRLMLVGLGKRANSSRFTFYQAGAAAGRAVTSKKIDTLAMLLPNGDDAARGLAVGLSQGGYGPGIRKSEAGRFAPSRITLTTAEPISENTLRLIRAEARGLWLARELVNTPPAELFPQSFAARAGEVASAAGLQIEVWDEHRLAAERMGSLLAVARGSELPPRFVILRYTGNPGGPVLALVGKGVTFDSGGLSLKTTDQMIDMKCDMAGAAAVLGGMQAIAEAKLPVNVLGILALVENMPSGKAMKLGDVLTARNGKTIEVLNTDAEGRLILADALAYAAEQKPAQILDFATLTGACLIALGADTAGLMTNNDAWGDRVLAAIARAGERAWKLPMDSHYDDLIKSKVADMRNTGGSRNGGAIAGAKLLQQFVGDVPWAHLDIAGPAWADSESPWRDAGGTGCMVRSIVELASQPSAAG